MLNRFQYNYTISKHPCVWHNTHKVHGKVIRNKSWNFLTMFNEQRFISLIFLAISKWPYNYLKSERREITLLGIFHTALQVMPLWIENNAFPLLSMVFTEWTEIQHTVALPQSWHPSCLLSAPMHSLFGLEYDWMRFYFVTRQPKRTQCIYSPSRVIKLPYMFICICSRQSQSGLLCIFWFICAYSYTFCLQYLLESQICVREALQRSGRDNNYWCKDIVTLCSE